MLLSELPHLINMRPTKLGDTIRVQSVDQKPTFRSGGRNRPYSWKCSECGNRLNLTFNQASAIYMHDQAAFTLAEYRGVRKFSKVNSRGISKGICCWWR
ncbi:MAG: hypothetical protein C0404_01680 [Verrucomicrobia bacterium]|nr:hypothetical protein [Verrucomicrobiota bacterium]